MGSEYELGEHEPLRVLVAGATGHLGRLVARELRARGVWVRALTRRAVSAKDLGADEAVSGELTAQLAPAEAFAGGIDVVFSALGNPVAPAPLPARRSFAAVDTALNLRLLEAAKAAGVRRFVYVSVFATEAYADTAYVRAHEAVVDAMRRSGLEWAVVRPTGFFSAFTAYLDMAKRGPVPLIGDGSARSNPIDDRDLAAVCADAVLSSQPDREVAAGGPEELTRREVAEAAFAALGKQPAFRRVPAGLVRHPPLPALLRPFDARLAELIPFFVAVGLNDCVAPRAGTRTLADFFAETTNAGCVIK